MCSAVLFEHAFPPPKEQHDSEQEEQTMAVREAQSSVEADVSCRLVFVNLAAVGSLAEL